MKPTSRLLTTLSILSLLACLATLLLYYSSRSTIHEIEYSLLGGSYFSIDTKNGRNLSLILTHGADQNIPLHATSQSRSKIPRTALGAPSPTPITWKYSSGNLYRILGFQLDRVETWTTPVGSPVSLTSPIVVPPTAATGNRLTLPLLHLALLFALLPTLHLLLLARRARWFTRPLPSTLCPTCRYDLRATPTRCPECGTEFLPQEKPQS